MRLNFKVDRQNKKLFCPPVWVGLIQAILESLKHPKKEYLELLSLPDFELVLPWLQSHSQNRIYTILGY